MKLRLRAAKAKVPTPAATTKDPEHKPLRVLNRSTSLNTKLISASDVCIRILALAQVMCGKKLYPYQVQIGYRIVESVLNRDGETLTALLSRQAGKSEVLSCVIVGILLMFPILAKKYPDDYRFNLTDEHGRYRGFNQGIKIGIYAPKVAQAEIMYNRVRAFLETDMAKKVLRELKIEVVTSNGDTVTLSHGSRLLCQTASINAKIEGETHHLLILEEAQDIDDKKIKKSLNPMVAATKGSIVMIGTATTKRCTFYETIKHNERMELAGHRRNHFFYPWQICSQYNSLYKEYIEQEKLKIGETSDEFLMSYGCLWLFERGMFVTQQQLFHKKMALCSGERFSVIHGPGSPLIPDHMSIVIGIDWGRDHDSTVVTAFAVDWQNPVHSVATNTINGIVTVDLFQKHLVDWKEFHGDNYEFQYHEICAYLNSWGMRLAKVVTDSNTCGKPIYDRLVATYMNRGVEIVPFNFTSRMKSDGYKALYAEICGQRITFPADKATVRSTSSYRKFVNQMLDLRKTYKGQLMVVAHPNDKHAHDDFCDSLMMGVYGCLTPALPTNGEIDFSDDNPFMR